MLLQFPQATLQFSELARRIHPAEGLVRKDWHQHSNGGGWVQKSAFVFLTAFVGPCAIVSGSARILDQASILDEASVTDLAVVADIAIVSGKARVGGRARILGMGRVGGEAEVGGVFQLWHGEISSGVFRPVRLPPRSQRKNFGLWGVNKI
jgi:hypothetical protein